MARSGLAIGGSPLAKAFVKPIGRAGDSPRVSSFLIELLVPVLIVLSLGIFRVRDAWIWSWATWLNDIDFLGWTFHVAYGWPNLHRALLHNLFLLLVVGAFGWRAWTKWQLTGMGGLAGFAAAKPGWLLVPFYYTCHLVLDIFAGGVALFWPVTSLSVYWDFELLVDTTKPVPVPDVETQAGTVAGVVDVSPTYLWMNSEQFAIFLLYLFALALTIVYERVQGRPAFAWLDRRPQDEPAPTAPVYDAPRPDKRRHRRPRSGG